MLLSSRVGGKDQHAVVPAQRSFRIADEPVAVQARDKNGVKTVRVDQFAERRNVRREGLQQLSQRVRLHIQLGQAGPLAWNAEKLNMHAVELVRMIAWNQAEIRPFRPIQDAKTQ
jgi:hypothetical protein